MRKVFSVVVNKEKYPDVFQKLSEVPNVSTYVRELVCKDLAQSESFSEGQIEKIKDIVLQFIGEKTDKVQQNTADLTTNRELLDSVENLFTI